MSELFSNVCLLQESLGDVFVLERRLDWLYERGPCPFALVCQCHACILGLYKSIEEDTQTLRELFSKEVSDNLDTYKKWINLPESDAQLEIEMFSKAGWFSSDIGDLCVMVCSRLVQAPIVVITSYIHAPYLPFLPEKLSSSQPLFIAFDHTAPGHYDSTQGMRNFTLCSTNCQFEEI